MAAEILAVKGLKKYFTFRRSWLGRSLEYVKAVDGIDFHINYGETLGLVGESGCGKSTTGRTIIRLLAPTEGEIFFEGQNITHLARNSLGRFINTCSLSFRIPMLR